MRTGLIIFGVIFLAIGGLLYFVPNQELSADTTTTDGTNVDIRTSTASLDVPVEWAYASGLMGIVLFIMGLVIPSSSKHVYTKGDSYERVVETTHAKETNDGNKHKFQRHESIGNRS